MNKRIKAALDQVFDDALHWKKLDKHGHGLGDYGNPDNLLEVVGIWLLEVPAKNARNIYGMRFVATLLERRRDSARAARVRSETSEGFGDQASQ